MKKISNLVITRGGRVVEMFITETQQIEPTEQERIRLLLTYTGTTFAKLFVQAIYTILGTLCIPLKITLASVAQLT